jgi:cell wall-associated NlpC family hydrolase
LIDFLPFLGIPWEQMSCWRLVAHVYAKQFGIILPTYDAADPEDRALVAKLIEDGRGDWIDVSRETPTFPDVLLFREDRIEPTHVGIVADDAWMLHVVKDGRSRMDLWDGSFRGRLWRPRLCSIWRHKDIAAHSPV